jgi:hypothetical protein
MRSAASSETSWPSRSARSTIRIIERNARVSPRLRDIRGEPQR